MGVLHLSDRDLEHLEAAHEALLSPLDGADPVDWQLRANRSVRRFLDADHSVFSVPTETAPAFATDDTDPTFPDRFLSYCKGVQDGEYRFRDPVVEQAARRRRSSGAGAYHERMLYGEEDLEHSAAYHDLFLPAGLTHMVGLSAPMPVGEATQFFGFDSGAAEERSHAALERLRLLLPAFRAGVRIHRSFHARRGALSSMVDGLDRALAVYSAGGAVLHRTSALRDLLADEPSADEVRAAVRELATALCGRWRVRSKTAEPPRPSDASRRVGTPDAEYRLTGSYLPRDVLGVEGVIIAVRRVRPILPSADRLRARFGLTPRQADVALLLAEGLTAAAIAERLGISRNTARRYSERVLKKLGVRSRAAVAITLLRDHAASGEP